MAVSRERRTRKHGCSPPRRRNLAKKRTGTPVATNGHVGMPTISHVNNRRRGMIHDETHTRRGGKTNHHRKRCRANRFKPKDAHCTIMTFELEPRQSIVIDQTSFLACESSVDIKACPSGSIYMMMFGGEGMFQCKLTGPGKVFLQSMPAGSIPKTTASAVRKSTGIKQKTS